MGPCAAALFIISSSEMRRVCRAATAVAPPKQQTGSASLYWLSAPVTDTGRQVIDSLHLPVMALRLRILNTAQESMAMLKTHTWWTWTSSEPSQCQPLGPSRKLRCPENMTWNNSIQHYTTVRNAQKTQKSWQTAEELLEKSTVENKHFLYKYLSVFTIPKLISLLLHFYTKLVLALLSNKALTSTQLASKLSAIKT